MTTYVHNLLKQINEITIIPMETVFTFSILTGSRSLPHMSKKTP